MLVNEIAYVLRNSMAAGIRATPFNYLWCSGPVYFNMMPAYPHKTIGEISSCNVSSRLHTKIKLPDHYRIRENGLIDPTCYVNHSKVETLFGNPGFMMACIDAKILTGNLNSECSSKHATLTRNWRLP